MRECTYYTLYDFAALIGVSISRVQRAIYASDCKLKRIGRVQIIDKAAFFAWYLLEGGAEKLDAEFVKSEIAHDVIRAELECYNEKMREGRL